MGFPVDLVAWATGKREGEGEGEGHRGEGWGAEHDYADSDADVDGSSAERGYFSEDEVFPASSVLKRRRKMYGPHASALASFSFNRAACGPFGSRGVARAVAGSRVGLGPGGGRAAALGGFSRDYGTQQKQQQQRWADPCSHLSFDPSPDDCEDLHGRVQAGLLAEL